MPTKECGANKRKGRGICRAVAMANGRCRMHGGYAPTGASNPNFKTGRYSKYLPPALLPRYNEALQDPELLNASNEISLIDARLTELLKRLDTRESGALWKQLNDHFLQFNKYKASGQVEEMRETLSGIEHIIKSGFTDYQLWSEIGALMDRRQRFVESERKRLVEMQQMITVDQAMTLVSALVEVVTRNVPDQKVRSTICGELSRIVAFPKAS